jgi:hypothetical protein
VMHEQNSLFVETSVDRFSIFHKKNPQVYKMLVSKCKSWRFRHPKKKLGIRMLWEAMRWDYMMQTDAEDFKLNNNHTPFYARMIMDCEPELSGIFELREHA